MVGTGILSIIVWGSSGSFSQNTVHEDLVEEKHELKNEIFVELYMNKC